MLTLILAVVLACPPLIEQELPERLNFCNGRTGAHQQECLRRLHRSAKMWGCKMPEVPRARVPDPEPIGLRGSETKSGDRPRT